MRVTPSDLLPTDDQWLTLTSDQAKRAAFETDLYFRETWDQWLALCADEPSPALMTVALLCAKPDAVVGRRLAPMLDYAIGHGFSPFGVVEFGFTRHSMRALWCHDWDAYPPDRLAFCTTWYTSARTLAFLLRDDRPEQVSASVRLCRLKGNAIAAERSSGDLRSALRCPNSVLNFVHVADEPADIIRELGILFERPERLAIMRMIKHRQDRDSRAEVAVAIASLEQRFQPHDLDYKASLQRMVADGILSDQASRYLLRCIREGTKLSWDEICGYADPEWVGNSRWDFIALASELIPLERGGKHR